jgi:hypothetical protein
MCLAQSRLKPPDQENPDRPSTSRVPWCGPSSTAKGAYREAWCPIRRSKYPAQHREAWRPATRPPNRKGEAVKRLIDAINRSDEAARQMLKPRPDLLKAWLAKAA